MYDWKMAFQMFTFHGRGTRGDLNTAKKVQDMEHAMAKKLDKHVSQLSSDRTMYIKCFEHEKRKLEKRLSTINRRRDLPKLSRGDEVPVSKDDAAKYDLASKQVATKAGIIQPCHSGAGYGEEIAFVSPFSKKLRRPSLVGKDAPGDLGLHEDQDEDNVNLQVCEHVKEKACVMTSCYTTSRESGTDKKASPTLTIPRPCSQEDLVAPLGLQLYSQRLTSLSSLSQERLVFSSYPSSVSSRLESGPASTSSSSVLSQDRLVFSSYPSSVSSRLESAPGRDDEESSVDSEEATKSTDALQKTE